MHRTEEIAVGDGKARCGADDRVDAAIRAKGSAARVLNPFHYITDQECFFTVEAAANIAMSQLRSVIDCMAVSGVERTALEVHERSIGGIGIVRNWASADPVRTPEFARL